MHSLLKRWLHIFGSVLGLVGVVFVVMRMNTYAEQIDFTRFDAAAWSLIGWLTIIYGAANVLIALAWWHLLAFFDMKVKLRWAVKTYGLSQLARYVPGNIFHLAGRQALGMAAGLPARALAKSALWELGLIAFAGVFFAFLAAPLVWSKLPILVSVGTFVVMSVGGVIALRRLLSPSVGAALIWQIFFLAISAAVFIGVLALVAPSLVTFSAFPAFCGAYVIAWLAGLVTPGAPAGIGVRELVLLFLFGAQIPTADLLLAVVVGRLVTVVGDFSYFMTAIFINSGERGNESSDRE